MLLARVTAARWALPRHIKQPDIRYHIAPRLRYPVPHWLHLIFRGCLMFCALSRLRQMKDINECCEWNCVYQQRINAYCIAMNVIMCEHYNCTQDCTTRRQPRKTMPIDNNKEHNRNHKIPSAKHKLQHVCCSKHTPPHHQISSHLHTTNFGLFCTNITLNHMSQPHLITTNAISTKSTQNMLQI